MAIAAALNILVNSPTEALTNDLKKHKVSISQFARELTQGLGTAYKKVENDAERIGRTLGIAFDQGVIGAKEYEKGLERAAAIQKYLTAGGQSYNAMQAEAAKLTETHTAAIDKQTAALARLQAMRDAGMIDESTLASAKGDLARSTYHDQYAALEQKGIENDKLADEARAKRRLDMQRTWDRLEQKGIENDKLADEAKAARRLRMHHVWDSLEEKARLSDELADKRRAERKELEARSLAHRTALFDEANALNAKHITPLERYNAAKLRLNTLNATGALTQAAFNAEMKAATALYAQQTTIVGRLGLTTGSLKSAASFINPWFAVAGALAMGAKEAANFEKAMDRVSAFSGASAETMEELSTAARALGRDTIFSAREAAEAMSELAKAGVNASDILTSVPAVMSLAAIGELEVGEAAKTAARMMAGMRIGASGLADVIDSIAVAASSSNTTVEDLGEAMKFVGPLAAQVGVSLDETMASLMVLSNAGLSGELGGTGLRNVLLRMIEPTAEAKAALDDLGVTLMDMQGNMLPMVDILRQFEQGLAGMGDVEKLQTIAEVFKTRSATTMSALLGAGSGGFQEMLDLQAQREGVAKEMEAVMNDNLKGDLEKLGSALADLAVAIFDSGLGVILRELALALVATVQTFALGFDTAVMAVFGFGDAIAFVGAGLLRFAGWLLSFIPGAGATGEAMRAQGEAWQTQANDRLNNRVDSWLESAAQQRTDIGGTFSRMAGVGDVGSDKLAGLKTKRDGLDGAAQSNVEMIKRMQAMQKLVATIDEAKAKSEEELEVLIFGADAVERRKLQEAGLTEIEELRLTLIEQGASDIANQLATQRAILGTKLAELKAMQEQAAIQQKANDLTEALKKAWEELATIGMTSGEQLLHNMPTATGAQRAQAAMLDDLESRVTLEKEINKAREDGAKLAAQMRDANWSKTDDTLFTAWQTAQADGIVSSQESAQLYALELELDRLDAIEAQYQARKRENEALEKNAQTLASMAKDMMTKNNPVLAFQDEFVKLQTMLSVGLIDKDTYNKSLDDLESSTMKSAGPKNIGYAAAVTSDSEAGYSASLRAIRNPEYDELKKQTDFAKRSLETQNKIKEGINKFKQGEALFSIP
jgi:TP901 family phage tail tape measure protein